MFQRELFTVDFVVVGGLPAHGDDLHVQILLHCPIRLLDSCLPRDLSTENEKRRYAPENQTRHRVPSLYHFCISIEVSQITGGPIEASRIIN